MGRSHGVETLRLRASAALSILMAAASAAGTATAADSLDEVVISARKVAEALADVPLSIQVITREEIREVAKKYLNQSQRLLLDYVPSKDKQN